MTDPNLYVLIERIGSLLRSEIRKNAAELGLQPVHIQALDYLSRCNRYSDTLVAVRDYLGATKGTVSQTLKVLEKKSLIRKINDKGDRRIIHLKISKLGEQILLTLLPPSSFRMADDQISPQARADLTRLLMEVLRKLQFANQSKTFGVCKTCGYFQTVGSNYRCGITKEVLSTDDSERICWEHSTENNVSAASC